MKMDTKMVGAGCDLGDIKSCILFYIFERSSCQAGGKQETLLITTRE